MKWRDVKMTNNNKGTYIPSIEAEEIYDMSVRGLENIMKYDYVGYIPFSLELNKLRSYKKLFSEIEISKNDKVKYQSDAVINVKFKNKVKAGKVITSFVRGYEKLVSRLNFQLESLKKSIVENEELIKSSNNSREQLKLTKTINYLNNKVKLVEGHIARIESDKENEIYQELKADELRNNLYTQGFQFKGKSYKFYKRTASKSRQSQALFIVEDLYDQMKEWSYMGLDLTGEIDVASLLAYESLVSSSLESTIEIDTKHIFIIDDKFSEFNVKAIEVGNDLKAVLNDNATIENNIWDGQGLMDISLFESIDKGNKGMALLRQHFMKCCVFNTNLQQFLQDNCPEGVNYDEWELTDFFGNKIPASQILLLTTPSSLKFLKYANGDKKKAYANWCKRVKKDKFVFGICKHEKSSKYNDRSFTSYQMINTLDANMDDVKEIAKFEVDYVKSLQGIKDENENIDDNAFMEYLEKKKELTNAYEMLQEMYKINPAVVNTQMFRDYRTKQISNYRTKIKGGKIRLEGDYATVVSNPYEMLEALLEGKRERKINAPTVLKGNEIYTKLHKFNEEYTLVRNPHNSQNNFFKVVNVDNELFNTYFNFTKNIVVINSIKNPVLSRLNGMDMDSDTTLIFKSEVFNKIVDKTLANREYPVILNTIKSKPNPVELTNENIANIDMKTAKSQMWIGEVTNAAQFQVSCLWDIQNNEPESVEKQEKIEEIQNNIAILVVLSNVAIDYSKKVVEVDIDGALRGIRFSQATKVKADVTDKKGNVETKLISRKKPNFWKYVSTSDVEMTEFTCPMDLLIRHIDNDIEKAPYRKNLPLSNIFASDEMKGADDKQIEDIIDLVKEFNEKINKVNQSDNDKKSQERLSVLTDAYNELDERLSKKKIRKATMYKLLTQVAEMYDGKSKKKDLSGIAIHLMNALYRTHGKTFLNLIKKG